MIFKKMCVLAILVLICLKGFVQPALAEPVDSTTLLSNSFKYDGKTIEFQGEAIGEIMKRKNHAWVNIHDGQNAIGVFMKFEDAKKIKYLGRHLVKGDIVLVKGVFNRSCKVHGGDTDIHAVEVKILKRGYMVQENIDKSKAVFALLIFSLGSFLMWIVFKNKW